VSEREGDGVPGTATAMNGTGGSGGAPLSADVGNVDGMPQAGCGGTAAAAVALPFTLLGLLRRRRSYFPGKTSYFSRSPGMS
jgi:hypothetical protein